MLEARDKVDRAYDAARRDEEKRKREQSRGEGKLREPLSPDTGRYTDLVQRGEIEAWRKGRTWGHARKDIRFEAMRLSPDSLALQRNTWAFIHENAPFRYEISERASRGN